MMKRLWQKWKRLSNKILDKEATIVLTLFYWLLIAPFALLIKISSDPLNIKNKAASFWFNKDTKNTSDIKHLKQQY